MKRLIQAIEILLLALVILFLFAFAFGYQVYVLHCLPGQVCVGGF